MIAKENISDIISSLGIPAVIIDHQDEQDNEDNGFYQYDGFDVHYIDHNELKFNNHHQHFTNNLNLYKSIIRSGDIQIKCKKVNNKYQYDVSIVASYRGTSVTWKNVSEQHCFLQNTLAKWDKKANIQSWGRSNTFHFKLHSAQDKIWINSNKLGYLIITHANQILHRPYTMNTMRKLFKPPYFTAKISISNSIKNKKDTNLSSNNVIKRYIKFIHLIVSMYNIQYKQQIALKHLPYDLAYWQGKHCDELIFSHLNVIIYKNKNREFISGTIKLSFSSAHYLYGLSETKKNNAFCLCMSHLEKYNEYLKKQIALKKIASAIEYIVARPNQTEEYNEQKHYINIKCCSYKTYCQILGLIYSKMRQHFLETKQTFREICTWSLGILSSFMMMIMSYYKIFNINIPSLELSLLAKEDMGQCHYFHTASITSNKENNDTKSIKKQCLANGNHNLVKLVTYLYCFDALKDNHKRLMPSKYLLNIICEYSNDGNTMHCLITYGLFSMPKANNNQHAKDDLIDTDNATATVRYHTNNTALMTM